MDNTNKFFKQYLNEYNYQKRNIWQQGGHLIPLRSPTNPLNINIGTAENPIEINRVD